jgi:hypothetical protein
MRTLKVASCAALLLSGLATANSAWAGNKAPNLGASTFSPGQDMRTSGGPLAGDHGASNWAPGQEMRDSNTSRTPPGQFAEPGASGFAPGDSISKGNK